MSSSAGPAPRRKGAAGDASFTDEMRDRQARGKDPYSKTEDNNDDRDEDDEDDDEGGMGKRRRLRLGHGPQIDSFEDREKRGYAMAVLGSPEQLMMYAQSTGDSVPGQRLHFMKMLCGFNPTPPAAAHQAQQQPGSKKSSSARRDGSGARPGERAAQRS